MDGEIPPALLSYIALIRNSLRRCTAHKHHVLWSRAGQTHKLMLMVTAPLYWPPASNVGSLSISPVCPCRYHPPKSRGAVERSCYLWVRGAIFFHIQPSEPQIPVCVSGPCCPPLAPFQPAQGPSIRKGTPPREGQATPETLERRGGGWKDNNSVAALVLGSSSRELCMHRGCLMGFPDVLAPTLAHSFK